MALAIESLAEEHLPAVKAFNARLTAASVPFDVRFPERSASDWLPKLEGRRLYQENFVVLENEIVRGGYRIKRQDFSFGGTILPVDCFHWPMSEAVINRAYSWLFMVMLRHVEKNHPLLYSLGMAGNERTLIPQLLKAAGWKVRTVRFFFKVNRGRRFLRQIQALRQTWLQRCFLDSAAWTGVGPLAIRTMQAAARREGRAVDAERVPGFAPWADELWNKCKSRYAMIAVRDSESLKLLYPASDEEFLCYRISKGMKLLGWAILLDTQMQRNKYFGDMRVGTILDCLAQPEHAIAVIREATRVLEERGVDLMLSNQSEAHWCAALQRAGFFRGPSNFSFGVSQELNKLLSPFESIAPLVHMTRGDGEGPIHLKAPRAAIQTASSAA